MRHKDIASLTVAIIIFISTSIGSISGFAIQPLHKNDIRVYIDQKEITFDQPPVSENGRILVPLRAIFEQIGADVYWNNGNQTATGILGKRVIDITVNKKEAYVNNRQIQLDVAAKAVNGRILVPLRFIAESLGCHVDWDGNKSIASISTAGRADEIPFIGRALYEIHEEKLLERDFGINKPNIRMINFKIINKKNNMVVAESFIEDHSSKEMKPVVIYNTDKVVRGETYEFHSTIVNYPAGVSKPTRVEGTYLNFHVNYDSNIYNYTQKHDEEYLNFVQSFTRPIMIPYLETAHFKWDYTIPNNIDYAISLKPSVSYDYYRSVDNYDPGDDSMEIVMKVSEEDNYYEIFVKEGKDKFVNNFSKIIVLPSNPRGTTNYNNKDDLKWLKQNFNYMISDEVGFSQAATYVPGGAQSIYVDIKSPDPYITIRLAENYVELTASDKIMDNEETKMVFLHTLNFYLGASYQEVYNRLSRGDFGSGFYHNNRYIYLQYSFERGVFYMLVGKPGKKFNQ